MTAKERFKRIYEDLDSLANDLKEKHHRAFANLVTKPFLTFESTQATGDEDVSLVEMVIRIVDGPESGGT